MSAIMKGAAVRPGVSPAAPLAARSSRTFGRTAPLQGRRMQMTVASSEGKTPLEVIQQENELLRRTIEAADSSVDQLEQELQQSGVAVPSAAPWAANDKGVGPSARWSPERPPCPGGILDETKLPPMSTIPDHDGTECLKWDDSLWSHAEHFKYRWGVYKNIRQSIDDHEGGMDSFTKERGYKFFGINRGEKEGVPGIWYREWAPACKSLCLVGEFNDWDAKENHWGERNDFGVFTLFLPDVNGQPAIKHRTKVKVKMETNWGEWLERIPAWIKFATQEWNEIQFNGMYYEPLEKSAPGVLEENKEYVFKYPRPQRPRALRIYECHVGMSNEEPVVNSYTDFKENVLPRIRDNGYNAIQIMAIQEHAYYGSFGYHVTNFFAPSSRCGTPDELKAMIDEAHRMGLVVLMDIVHSHASKNVMDGINMFDGTDGMYFHSGPQGYHWMWDSRCFNYGNWETLRYLLSNTRYWLDEFKFDGFRFDGVTSMMYKHHGLQMDFTGNYDEYFGMSTDADALVYLMLMNDMIHSFFPQAITIGEDVSGMPTFCRPVSEGGVGFDYRLQMAIADKWIEVMAMDDWSWNMGNICHTMTNRRYAEPCVGYAESHDQALVGDKTIAFWLMDKDMYDFMAAPGFGPSSPTVDRGIALHKMIRLITMTLGGESYLNFMGNEFGHPEWIDFPRDDTYSTSTGEFIPGNGGSLDKCRRRWDLADADYLKYQYLLKFDRAMMHLDKAFGFVSAPHTWVSRKDEGDKVIVAERGDLVFVFNFHPTQSYTDYRVGCCNPGPYKLVLSSDEAVFGGYENVSKKYNAEYVTSEGNYDNRPHSFQVYSTSRTVAVYAPAEFCDATADEDPDNGIPGLGVKGQGPYFET